MEQTKFLFFRFHFFDRDREKEIFIKIRGLSITLTSLTMEQAKYYKKISITKQILNYMIIQLL